MRDLLFVLIILACPLMMFLMMRGHGHGHADRSGRHEASTAELRRRRDELDRVIAEREPGSVTSPSDFACHRPGGGR